MINSQAHRNDFNLNSISEDIELLRVCSHALDFLDEAVMITDSQKRIVRVNTAFTRWTGYTAAEAVGKSPAILQSGQQSQEFYQTMWDALRLDGVWHGELINRRKNGDIYPERLTITALINPDNQVTYYIGTFIDSSAHKQQEKRLQRLAMYDELTGLPNRRMLQNHLDQAMARSIRHERVLAVCMLDLDGFKPVNDVYGHEAGDQVLAVLGKRMPEALRKTDLVARLGGDEFVLLIEDIAGMDDLIPILDKIHTAITEPVTLRNGETVQVGTSLGIYLYPFGEEEIGDQLLRCADQALYESKIHKADRERFWAIFGEKINRTGKTNASRLLNAGALEVSYQPVIANKTDQIISVEALARLRDDDGRILYPEEFMTQLDAKRQGELSLKVLTQALTDLAGMDDLGLAEPLRVSFNVNPKSFDAHFIQKIREIIAASGIAPARITLETLLKGNDFIDSGSALPILRELKAMGLRLSLDDIGASYGSPLRLKELPIDEIKLDQKIVQNLDEMPQGLHFIRVIQDLSMELKVDLVIEGVETETILDAMMTTGAPYLQGYAIARPCAPAKLRELLSVRRVRQPVLPRTLFGYYAGTMASHSSIKKMFMLNPGEIDSTALGDSRQCRGHSVQERLGHGEGTHMAQLHYDYHCALGKAAKHAADHFKNEHWDAVEEKLEILLKHILDESQKQSGNNNSFI